MSTNIMMYRDCSKRTEEDIGEDKLRIVNVLSGWDVRSVDFHRNEKDRV